MMTGENQSLESLPFIGNAYPRANVLLRQSALPVLGFEIHRDYDLYKSLFESKFEISGVPFDQNLKDK